MLSCLSQGKAASKMMLRFLVLDREGGNYKSALGGVQRNKRQEVNTRTINMLGSTQTILV